MARNEKIYKVKGMHCKSCEVLIERKLVKEKGVLSANARIRSDDLVVTYRNEAPTISHLNKLFKRMGIPSMKTKKPVSRHQARPAGTC